jgi:hypothetical protein
MGEHSVGGFSSLFRYEFLAVLLGAASYVLVFVFFHQSIVAGFFGREPVQNLWGRITGYEMRGSPQAEFRTDSEGRPAPLWVVLVPYLVPIYTMVGVLLVWIVGLVFGFSPYTHRVVQGYFIGLTYTFHLFLVFYDIHERHPDLRAAGYFFTLVLILLVNIQFLAAVAMVVLKGASWIDFNRALFHETVREYRWFWEVVTGPFR